MRRLLALLALMPFAAQAAPQAEAQREPEIKAAVQHAIDQAECFEDRYDSAVWYKMMEPRLRKRVPDREERMAVLKYVFCEANRPGEARIPPGLVMAIIDIESGFNLDDGSPADATCPQRTSLRRTARSATQRPLMEATLVTSVVFRSLPLVA